MGIRKVYRRSNARQRQSRPQAKREPGLLAKLALGGMMLGAAGLAFHERDALEKIISRYSGLGFSQEYKSGEGSADSGSKAYRKMVYSSNTSRKLAEQNLKSLERKGIEAALEQANVNGKTFYRTIISEELPDGSEPRLEYLTKVATINGESIFLSKYPEASFEGMPKDDYVKKFSGHIRKVRGQDREWATSHQQAAAIASDIYDKAREFDIPVLALTALLENESGFRDVEGDLKFKKDGTHSEGMGQMRKPTQEDTWNRMKRIGVTDLPDKKPGSIIGDQRLQLTFYASHLRTCIDSAGGDLTGAVRKYNAGLHSRPDPNSAYVVKFHRKRSGYLSGMPGGL